MLLSVFNTVHVSTCASYSSASPMLARVSLEPAVLRPPDGFCVMVARLCFGRTSVLRHPISGVVYIPRAVLIIRLRRHHVETSSAGECFCTGVIARLTYTDKLKS